MGLTCILLFRILFFCIAILSHGLQVVLKLKLSTTCGRDLVHKLLFTLEYLKLIGSIHFMQLDFFNIA